MGAGSGGGISGISTTGASFTGFTTFASFETTTGFRSGLAALRTGFGRRAFAPRALLGFAFAGLRALWPDFRDARAFAMTAYATVGRGRRQRRNGPRRA